MAMGVGLHFCLRPVPEGPSLHLKIAQPAEVALTDEGLQIGRVKYIQWDGRTIARAPGTLPFTLLLNNDSPAMGARRA
jgi:hypothetical protein